MHDMTKRLLIAAALIAAAPPIAHVQQRRPQPGTRLTDDEIKAAVAPMRAGRKLTPKVWPNGAKVAVCLSWDMDNESFNIAAGNTAPVVLSQGEYGAAAGVQRILALYSVLHIQRIAAISGAHLQSVPRRIRSGVQGRHDVHADDASDGDWTSFANHLPR
jgi:hypothetical protein